MARSTVDLPEPDSPTMPKVSPAATAKLTSRTASTRWRRAVAETTTVEIVDHRELGQPGAVRAAIAVELGSGALPPPIGGRQSSRPRV